MAAFELKTQTCLQHLEQEVAALAAAPLCVGQVAIACALGYIDYRFNDLGWHKQAPGLAEWHAQVVLRSSFQATKPVDG